MEIPCCIPNEIGLFKWIINKVKTICLNIINQNVDTWSRCQLFMINIFITKVIYQLLRNMVMRLSNCVYSLEKMKISHAIATLNFIICKEK